MPGLADSVKLNNGLIIAMGHYGSFALVPLVISRYFKKRVNVVVLDNGTYYTQEIEKFRDLFSKYSNVRCLELNRKANLFASIKTLRDGEIVLVYADANYAQADSNGHYVECKFLGHNIRARTGVGQLSYLSGAPIAFATVHVARDSECVSISNCIAVTEKDKEENFKSIMQSFYHELEKEIVDKPENWFLWNLVHHLIIRGEMSSNNDISETRDCLFKIDINKLFYFEYGNEHFLHLVDMGSNLRMSTFHMDVLRRFLKEGYTVNGPSGSLNEREDERTKKLVQYLIKYNALIKG